MKQIRLCGLGGQGIVLAGTILAHAAFLDRKFVALSSGYASQVRGGITKSDLIISDSFINFPLVTRIDLLIAMLDEAYQESLPELNQEAKVVLDGTMVKLDPSSPAKHYQVPATEIVVKQLKNEMAANIVLLAAANSICKIVSEASLEAAIKKNVSPRFLELNLRAMQTGMDLAKTAFA
jgi:2-oxoglutarate ferredoxin oxidoreductase subunit gamma